MKKPMFLFLIAVSLGCLSGCQSTEADQVVEEKKEKTEQETGSSFQLPKWVERVYVGKEEEFRVNAEVVCEAEEFKQGTVRIEEIPEQAAKGLYGEAAKWETWEEEGSWQYGEEKRYLLLGGGTISYENKTMEEKQETNTMTEAEGEALIEQLLEKLSIHAKIAGRKRETSYDYFLLTGTLEGIPISEGASLHPVGTMEIANGELSYLSFQNNMAIESEEAAELLPMEQILELLGEYVENELILPSYSKQEINRIEYQYFVEAGKERLIFRPAWSFQMDYRITAADVLEGKKEEYLLVDAQTGEILKYWGE